MSERKRNLCVLPRCIVALVLAVVSVETHSWNRGSRSTFLNDFSSLFNKYLMDRRQLNYLLRRIFRCNYFLDTLSPHLVYIPKWGYEGQDKSSIYMLPFTRAERSGKKIMISFLEVITLLYPSPHPGKIACLGVLVIPI